MSTIFYVSNLGQSFDIAELESIFMSVGDVKSCRVEMQPDAVRGIGVVEMATVQQASDCVELFNGTAALGQTLSVTASKPSLGRRVGAYGK